MAAEFFVSWHKASPGLDDGYNDHCNILSFYSNDLKSFRIANFQRIIICKYVSSL